MHCGWRLLEAPLLEWLDEGTDPVEGCYAMSEQHREDWGPTFLLIRCPTWTNGSSSKCARGALGFCSLLSWPSVISYISPWMSCMSMYIWADYYQSHNTDDFLPYKLYREVHFSCMYIQSREPGKWELSSWDLGEKLISICFSGKGRTRSAHVLWFDRQGTIAVQFHHCQWPASLGCSQVPWLLQLESYVVFHERLVSVIPGGSSLHGDSFSAVAPLVVSDSVMVTVFLV